MLTSNHKQVKCFRLYSKKTRKVESVKKKIQKGGNLCMPKSKLVSESDEGKLVGTYSTGKEQHLHTTCLMSDNENFLTSDESHVMMWNLERPGKSEVYNLIDYNRHKYQAGEERILSMSCS